MIAKYRRQKRSDVPEPNSAPAQMFQPSPPMCPRPAPSPKPPSTKALDLQHQIQQINIQMDAAKAIDDFEACISLKKRLRSVESLASAGSHDSLEKSSLNLSSEKDTDADKTKREESVRRRRMRLVPASMGTGEVSQGVRPSPPISPQSGPISQASSIVSSSEMTEDPLSQVTCILAFPSLLLFDFNLTTHQNAG